MRGWLVNDTLTCIPGTRTLWHELRDGLELYDHTGTPFPYLASAIELRLSITPHKPDFIIRNASYFGPIKAPVPQIVLIQDILTGYAREMQLVVAQGAAMVVFNSDYTRAAYPELAEVASRVIPLGVDSELFRVMPEVERTDSILFVGSRDPVKGYPVLVRLIESTPYRYTLVMKDALVIHERAVCHVNVPQAQLARIMNTCRMGLCLSRHETQHLAGIEMGLCGLELLSTPVGVYSGREPGVWGHTFGPHELHESIDEMMSLPPCDPVAVRAYWLEAGFTIEGCISAWKEAITACLGLSQ